MPVVLITNMVPVAKSVGANRIVPGVAITNPLCDPALPQGWQLEQRRQILLKALAALETNIAEQTIF